MTPPLHADRDDLSHASWSCPSCGCTATTPFCGACGEQRPDGTGRAVRADDRRPSFPRRVLESLRALVTPPGRLTADWLRGRRVTYLAPLSVFLWINVVFFVVQSASGLSILAWPLRAHLSDDSFGWLAGQLLAQHRPDALGANADYAHIFDALESVHAKSLVIFMVPAFAFAVSALLFGRRIPLRHSLIFATHFFAFALIWLSVLFAAVAFTLHIARALGAPLPVHHWMDVVISSLEAAAFGWYLYVALGTVFALSRTRRLVGAFALIAALYVILKIYHVVVFAATLYST